MPDKELRRMTLELDQMTHDVTPEEADLLERVLEAFGDGKKPKPKDAEEIRKMHERYLVSREPDPDSSGLMEEGDMIVTEEDLDGE